jgi:hypothetical protein
MKSPAEERFSFSFYQIIALPDNLFLSVYNICTPFVPARMHRQTNQAQGGKRCTSTDYLPAE